MHRLSVTLTLHGSQQILQCFLWSFDLTTNNFVAYVCVIRYFHVDTYQCKLWWYQEHYSFVNWLNWNGKLPLTKPKLLYDVPLSEAANQTWIPFRFRLYGCCKGWKICEALVCLTPWQVNVCHARKRKQIGDTNTNPITKLLWSKDFLQSGIYKALL